MKAPKAAVKPAKKEKNQIQNMFKVLQPDEGDDDSAEEVLYIRSVEGFKQSTDELGKEKGPKGPKGPKTRMMPYASKCHEERCGCEGAKGMEMENERIREKVSFVNAVGQDGGWASLGKGDIIVDSAADESCWPIGPGEAFPTKEASRKMILRTANGGDMEHYGEKEVIFKYGGGEEKDPVGLKFQVTDRCWQSGGWWKKGTRLCWPAARARATS